MSQISNLKSQISNLNSLRKEERLCGDRVIANLFDSGYTFFESPYKVFWAKIPEINSFPCRFAVSSPKRRIKSAVKRNLVKRRTREVYRTNKHILYEVVTNFQVHLMVVYATGKLLPNSDLEKSMKKILQRIAKQYVESF